MNRRTALFMTVMTSAFTLAGCDLSMTEQRKLTTYAPTKLWSDGTTARPLPRGVVAEGDVQRAAVAKNPPPVTSALLDRGRERFGIFCAPCHGLAGDATESSCNMAFRHRHPITSIACSRRRRSISTT